MGLVGNTSPIFVGEEMKKAPWRKSFERSKLSGYYPDLSKRAFKAGFLAGEKHGRKSWKSHAQNAKP
jgi:hypothetical protein